MALLMMTLLLLVKLSIFGLSSKFHSYLLAAVIFMNVSEGNQTAKHIFPQL